MKDAVKVAPNFTVGDWKNLRKKLKFQEDIGWDVAFQLFQDRIDSRFLDPIEKIKHDGKNKGEGFSISLISVVLLEFIAAFELGKIYTTNRENLCPNEYSASAKLLKSFFSQSSVFNSRIKGSNDRDSFYKNIRCGLVHEARTKGSDIIISQGSNKNTRPDLIYFKVDGEYRLNRDLLLQSIKEHIVSYRDRLLQNTDKACRRRFLMKVDELAGLKHAWYFIYGSNLNESQLKERLQSQGDDYLMMQRCKLLGYRFVYNKASTKDHTAKGNLIEDTNAVTEGIAILLLESTLDAFIACFEKGYKKAQVKLFYECIGLDNDFKGFNAYTCISSNLTTSPPSRQYVSKVLEGAREKGLPEKYINENLFFDFTDA
jgi:hypothetical protein